MALGQAAYSSKPPDVAFPASFAVDGEVSSCAISGTQNARSWIAVELPEGQIVNKVKLWLWSKYPSNWFVIALTDANPETTTPTFGNYRICNSYRATGHAIKHEISCLYAIGGKYVVVHSHSQTFSICEMQLYYSPEQGTYLRIPVSYYI